MPDAFGNPTQEELWQQALRGGRASPALGSINQSAVDPAMVQDFSGQERAIDAQRQYANALRGKSAPQGKTVGPSGIYVAPNWGENLQYAAEQLMGGYQAGKANRADEGLDADRTASALAKATEEQDRFAAKEGREEEKLRLLQGAADRDATPDKTYAEFTDGKTDIRGYQQDGIGYDEDGNRLPDGFTIKHPPRGSGLGGRHYVTTMKDNSGNEIVTRLDPYDPNSLPEFLMVGENGENIWTQDRAAAYAAISSKTEADAAGEKETTVGGVKSNQARIDGLTEEIPAIQKQVGAYYEAIQAVASGANTGPFAGRMPSFTDASVWLDNIQQELGLAKISQYTFGSLSQAEGEWVRESSIPQNMDEKYLSEFLMRKAEGAKRMLNARRFERAYREKFGERPKDSDVDAILYEGGFTYGVPKEWLKDEEK
jgi:hypothetical protein